MKVKQRDLANVRKGIPFKKGTSGRLLTAL
jgi:hypothetical protein